MKKLIITLVIAGIAALGFSVKANAQEFHVKKLVCVQPEGYVFPDAIYFRYRINSGSTKRYPGSSDLSFTRGAERSDFCYFSVNRDDTIHIELWDNDTFDDDDFLGSFEVKVDWQKEETVTLRQSNGTAVYRLTYVIE